jgi:ATP-dependent DNA helicase RecQ
VATIAFGMGIDKADIRYVYHYNLPKSLENYSQEIGRSGRDGQRSTCEMFVCSEDLNVLENFVYGDTPSAAAVRGLTDELFRLGQEFDISLHTLGGQFDIRPIVVRTLLTYLELDGYLQEGTPFYSKYQFQPNISSAEMLSHFEGERQDFLRNVLSTAEKAKIWFSIDLEQASRKAASPRDRVVRALDYLAEQGWLQLKVEGVRNRFHVLKQPADLAALAADLHRRMLKREEREIGRLQQVLGWAGHDGCQVARLCEHFGEKLDRNCGHCSWCTSSGRVAAGNHDRRKRLERGPASAGTDARSAARPALVCSLSLRHHVSQAQPAAAQFARAVRRDGRCPVCDDPFAGFVSGWHAGQKNVERCACTIRTISARPQRRQIWPARS